MTDRERLGTGTVYESNGSKYIYLKRPAVEALDVSGGDHVDVFAAGEFLEVRPQNELAAVVSCRYCETPVQREEIATHHFENHPDRRYDPVWYHGTDADTDRCPNCGSEPSSVSWQTAPGQLVCGNSECPVNSWNPDGGDLYA